MVKPTQLLQACTNDASKRSQKLGLVGYSGQPGSLDVQGPLKTFDSCNTSRRRSKFPMGQNGHILVGLVVQGLTKTAEIKAIPGGYC